MDKGKLTLDERFILRKAAEILDNWVEAHEGDEEADGFVLYAAESGSGFVGIFLSETERS